MDAARDNRRQLGQIMVDEGLLTNEQLAHALSEQGRTGRPLGTLLVELGFVSSGAVANALAEQHGGLLKTEFGISAGLRAVPNDSTLGRHVPEPVDGDTRVEQLEATLRTVVAERDGFIQNVNELQGRIAELEAGVQARLSEAAKARAAEVAHVTACAAARIDELEAELRARASEPAPADDSAGIAELEESLQAAVAARTELESVVRLGATRIAELQQELTELQLGAARAAAADLRIAELEAEAALGSTRIAELQQELTERQLDDARAAAGDARIAELEADAALASTRISELEGELAKLHERRELDELAAMAAPAEQSLEHAHLLFVPSADGYALIEWPGPAPDSGTLLDVDGSGFVVSGIGRSPFPGSPLRCAFLDRAVLDRAVLDRA